MFNHHHGPMGMGHMGPCPPFRPRPPFAPRPRPVFIPWLPYGGCSGCGCGGCLMTLLGFILFNMLLSIFFGGFYF